MSSAILLISCPDQKGITASVTQFVFANNGNIIHADQHIDDQANTFFMRIEWSLAGFAVDRKQIASEFQPIAERFSMQWNLYFSDDVPNVALFVSKRLHCLVDILYRVKAGQLKCRIPLIFSNHPDARSVADEYRIKYICLPVTKDNKTGQESKQIELLRSNQVDLILLARYHQIFTKDFVEFYRNKIINIHHSFLPAFAGRDPYAQAYAKGVKLIGATSHYVTEKLDEGPIIEQGTVRISHRDSLEDLVQKGEDLERIVFSRAVKLSLERKILTYQNKTVIFD